MIVLIKMSFELEIINPLSFRGWNELVLEFKDYSFFHSSEWARVLYESYQYKPLYFTLINNDHLNVLIPLMEVKSFLTARRGVSLPFTDYCQPLVKGEAATEDVVNDVINYGRRVGWQSLEFRSEGLFNKNIPRSSYFDRHTLDLSQDENKIFHSFRNNTKRNIKKAIREGVKVDVYDSFESIKDFYRLHCMTRKKHGAPPQPFQFFRKIYEHIISKNKGFVILANHRKVNVAAAVYFHFGEKVIYKFGASDMRYQHLRANNLVMWEAIKWYCQNKYKTFCFGRTERKNKGLLRFKSGWGTEQTIITYYKYNLKKDTFLTEPKQARNFYTKAFMRIPTPALKWTGRMLYKHIG